MHILLGPSLGAVLVPFLRSFPGALVGLHPWALDGPKGRALVRPSRWALLGSMGPRGLSPRSPRPSGLSAPDHRPLS